MNLHIFTFINRTVESQSDCKDHQCLQSGCNKMVKQIKVIGARYHAAEKWLYVYNQHREVSKAPKRFPVSLYLNTTNIFAQTVSINILT